MFCPNFVNHQNAYPNTSRNVQCAASALRWMLTPRSLDVFFLLFIIMWNESSFWWFFLLPLSSFFSIFFLFFLISFFFLYFDSYSVFDADSELQKHKNKKFSKWRKEYGAHHTMYYGHCKMFYQKMRAQVMIKL